jgi:hypothetical protein
VKPLLRAASTLAAAALAAGLLAGCGADGSAADAAAPATASASPSPSPSADESTGAGLEFPGQTGKTALELLLEHDPQAQVSGKGVNAFVTTIGGRAADDAKKEFWALYVDGEQAQVGAGSLQTTDGQTITWKLETY